eukprot:comp22357_c1_seq2/m.33297 comp22357_c1_seq2/g.33297  ORF comp22357_c1_seq2/g.33297 comp22357_c1_seq2/m.33297 type:complete len:270 (-) comp22357_c1_seq2:8-817(-)
MASYIARTAFRGLHRAAMPHIAHRALVIQAGQAAQRMAGTTPGSSAQAGVHVHNTAEQVCENLLKSMPQTSASGPKAKQRRIFTALVQNEPGVLSKISGMISSRGFNIDSLVVGRTDIPNLSRMTLVFHDTNDATEQLRAQLEDLVPVYAVFDYTDMKVVEREMCLVKISLDRENADLPVRMRRDLNRRSLTELTALFGGRVQDVGLDSIVVELATKPANVVTFLSLLRPYGVLETARTGVVAMARAPVESEHVEEEEREIDLASLPPS